MVKRRVLLLAALTILSVTLISGCSNKEDKGETNEETGVDVADVDVEDEVEILEHRAEGEILDVNEIIFDLVSALEGVRDVETMEKYPAEPLYVVDTSEIEEHICGDDCDHENDDSDREHKVIETVYTVPERIQRFLDDTNTKAEDYRDLYLAYYPEDDYIAGLVVPNKPSITMVKLEEHRQKVAEQSSGNSVYKNAPIQMVRGCLILAIDDNHEDYINGMSGYLNDIYKILNESVVNSPEVEEVHSDDLESDTQVEEETDENIE